jgi:hypothetical protein
VLLWLASLAAGFADNWFALRRVREVVSNHRRLVHGLGAMRAQRCAAWLERNVATIAGSLSLALLLGLAPVVAAFFSLPLDIRHVTLAAGALTAAVFSLGWETLMTPAFWLAAGGVAVTALLSVAVAFACALALALRSRDLPRRAAILRCGRCCAVSSCGPCSSFFRKRRMRQCRMTPAKTRTTTMRARAARARTTRNRAWLQLSGAGYACPGYAACRLALASARCHSVNIAAHIMDRSPARPCLAGDCVCRGGFAGRDDAAGFIG